MKSKTEKPKSFGTKTEKPLYKITKTAKPKIPIPPSLSNDYSNLGTNNAKLSHHPKTSGM